MVYNIYTRGRSCPSPPLSLSFSLSLARLLDRFRSQRIIIISMRHDNSDSLYYRPTEGNGTRPLKLFFVFFFRLVKRETGKSEMPSSLVGAMESENETEANQNEYDECGNFTSVHRAYELPIEWFSSWRNSRNITRNKFPLILSSFFLLSSSSEVRNTEERVNRRMILYVIRWIMSQVFFRQICRATRWWHFTLPSRH